MNIMTRSMMAPARNRFFMIMRRSEMIAATV
jgi:hypothetical protein